MTKYQETTEEDFVLFLIKDKITQDEGSKLSLNELIVLGLLKPLAQVNCCRHTYLLYGCTVTIDHCLNLDEYCIGEVELILSNVEEKDKSEKMADAVQQVHELACQLSEFLINVLFYA